MPVLIVTISLPELLYQRLRTKAERAGHSLEAEAAELLTIGIQDGEQLPLEVEDELASLAFLDDESLWRAARNRLAADTAERLQMLHDKAQDEGLTDQEAEESAILTRRYEQGMLVRAEAAYLLKQRGHDVDVLLVAP